MKPQPFSELKNFTVPVAIPVSLSRPVGSGHFAARKSLPSVVGTHLSDRGGRARSRGSTVEVDELAALMRCLAVLSERNTEDDRNQQSAHEEDDRQYHDEHEHDD